MVQSLDFLSVLALPSWEGVLTGKPPGCDVMGTLPSVAVTVTVHREGQGRDGFGASRSILQLRCSAQKEERPGVRPGSGPGSAAPTVGPKVPSLPCVSGSCLSSLVPSCSQACSDIR